MLPDARALTALLALYVPAFLLYVLLPQSRADTALFLGLYGGHCALGLALLYLGRGAKEPDFRSLLWLFLLPRLLVFPMEPWLSDDALRYLWDGAVLLHGDNPYLYTPNAAHLSDVDGSLYHVLDYKDIHTIYPPLAQMCFAAAVWLGRLFSPHWLAGFYCWKALLLACEAGGFLLLARAPAATKAARKGALLYALAPLAVIEVAGQGHMDGLLILPFAALMLMAWRFGASASAIQFAGRAGVLGGLACLIKVLPAVLLLPFLRLRLGFAGRLYLAAAFVVTLLLFGLPFFHNPQAGYNLAATVRFYSGELQFNGVALYVLLALPEFLRWPDWWKSAPLVLNVLRFAAVLLAARLARVANTRGLIRGMCLCYLAVLLLSAKVHTWYFVPLLLLNISIGFRWLYFFAHALMFTYAMYLTTPPQEAYALQYGLWGAGLAAAVLEWRHGRKSTEGAPA